MTVPMKGWGGGALHPQGQAPGHRCTLEHQPGASPKGFGSRGPAPLGRSAFLLHILVFSGLSCSLHSRASGAPRHRVLL